MSSSVSLPEVSDEDALKALSDITNDSSNLGAETNSNKDEANSVAPNSVLQCTSAETQVSSTTTAAPANGSSASRGATTLSQGTVDRLLRRTRWSTSEKKKFLKAYGFNKYKDMLAFRKQYLHCEKSYGGVLHALYVKLKLKGKADLDRALRQKTLQTIAQRCITVNGKPVPFSVLYGLARVDGEKDCITLAKIAAPLETGNPERVQNIRNLFETQSEEKLKDGKKELKMQYFGKMKEYLGWLLNEFHLEDENGSQVPVTLPVSKHLYGVEFIKAKLRDDVNDGKGYSASTIKHCVQALNQIWLRESVMYPELVRFETPGENKVFKSLVLKGRNRKVERSLENFEDRGKNGHLNQLKKEDLLNLEHFVLSFHPDLVDSYTADEFREMGLRISTDPEIEKERVKQIKDCLREFATDYDVICYDAMIGVCTNTYLRGQQVRGFQLPDISIRECPAMGSTTFPGFKPPILVVFQINDSKNQGGDIVEFSYMGRHLDVTQCGTSRLSFHVVLSFSDLNGENQVRDLPDFSKNENWYKWMLFCPDPTTPEKRFAWKDQAAEVNRMNMILGIKTSGVVHATRHFMDLNDAPPQDVARLSLYQNGLGVMEKVYLKSPPCRAIRGRTGFSWHGTEWFLPRQALWIEDLSANKEWKRSRDSEFHLVRSVEVSVKNGPNSFRKVIKRERRPNYYLLVLEIFPFLPKWKNVFDLSWIAKNPEQTYLAAQGFVSFVEYMAVVFLQDAVLLMERYPDFGLYQHKVFKHPLWVEFKEESQTLMKGLECVAAFKPVSEKHAPEIQAELKQVHSCMRETKAENLALKSEMDSMNSKIARLESNLSLVKKQLSLQLSIVQKQNALLGEELNRKLDRLLGGDGATSTCVESKSMDTVNHTAVVSSPATAPKQPPAKRQKLSPAEATAQEVQSAQYQLDQARRRAFETAKPFIVPTMKSHPRDVYKAFFVKAFGRFKGLLAGETEAELLGVSKEDFLKMPSTAALEAQTGKKAKKSSAPRRFRELKRVAAMYKDCYEQQLSRVVIPEPQSLSPEDYVHKLALEAFTTKAIALGGLAANFEPGKHSLQKLCNILQANANPNKGKKGRPPSKKMKDEVVSTGPTQPL